MAVQEKHKTLLLKIIHKYLPDCKIWLFGSRAHEHERAGSDVDLALDTGKQIPLSVIIKIRLALQETTIPMDIDLVDLHSVSDAFKNEVLKEGVLWTK